MDPEQKNEQSEIGQSSLNTTIPVSGIAPAQDNTKEVVVVPENIPQATSHKKVLIVLGIVTLLIILIGAGYYFVSSRKVSVTPEAQSLSKAINQNKIMDSIIFNGNNYTKGFSFPPQDGADYSSESYEWVTGGETVENWNALITTHKLTPLSADKPLSAAAYAENIVSLNEGNGAVTMETSLINTPDAIAEGVDPNNPPYLYAYAFPGADGNSSEIGIQKVINGANGGLEIFIFGMHTGDANNTDAYFKSEQFVKDRLSVIKAGPLP